MSAEQQGAAVAAIGARTTNKWMSLTVSCTGAFSAALDANMLFLAYPTLQKQFNTDATTLAWVTLAPTLLATGLIFTVGRLGDVMSRGRVYTVGLLISALGLALSATSGNIGQLILFRLVQAVGNSMTTANSTAIIAEAFPDKERGRAMGIWMTVTSVGFASGPLLAGVLIDSLGWRSIFYIRIPLYLAAAVVTWLILGKQPSLRKGRLQFDMLGSVAIFVALATLIFAINQGPGTGFTSPMIVGAFVAAAVFGGLFMVIEARARAPVVSLKLFSDRLFASANAAIIVYFVGYISLTFLMPFYLVEGKGLSASMAGTILMTVPLARMTVSTFSGWLAERISTQFLTITGLAMMAVGLFLVSRLTAESTILAMMPGLVLVGLGNGVFEPPNANTILGSAPKDRLGMASASMTASRQIGGSSGVAIGGAIYETRYGTYSGSQSNDLAVTGAFKDAMLAGALFVVLGMVVSAARGSKRV